MPLRARARACPGVRVVIEMTPPIADSPNASGELPRYTSTLSTSPMGSVDTSTPPPAAMLTGTPSTKMRT